MASVLVPGDELPEQDLFRVRDGEPFSPGQFVSPPLNYRRRDGIVQAEHERLHEKGVFEVRDIAPRPPSGRQSLGWPAFRRLFSEWPAFRRFIRTMPARRRRSQGRQGRRSRPRRRVVRRKKTALDGAAGDFDEGSFFWDEAQVSRHARGET